MIEMFGLRNEDIKTIQNTLEEYDEIEKAFIFGSRAIGNFKKGSDIDIAITGEKISPNTLADLNMVLNEESPLPYFFDLIHYEKLSNTNLKEHIDTIGIEIYNDKVHILL